MARSVATIQIEQLVALLDEDIQHLEKTLSQLDALRCLLIKRDDAALDRLLGEIRQQAEAYAANERRRQDLRADLAEACGLETGRLTLSRLRAALPQQQRMAIGTRQERLSALVTRMKCEYSLTVMLVSDVARFNRSLVRAVFGASGKGCISYHSNGAARQQTDRTLMSLQL